MTKVIFRKCNDGDIIALFPYEACNSFPSQCSSYEHIGQHGAADYSFVIDNSKPAKREEYEELLKELADLIGYDDLQVLSRAPSRYVTGQHRQR